MSAINSQRKSCKDVFNAFLVVVARYAGLFEFPVINRTNWIPNRLIAFSKAVSSNDYDQWIHFFEDDYLFERIWRNPARYLNIFKRFNGVILPDFSLYRDMPFVMQLWNIYRSRAIGCWLQRHGIKVIVNIRFGDQRTYKICCDGISKNSTIAIGTHGTMFFATPFGRKLQSKNGESCISKKEKNAEGGMRAYQHPAIHHKQCSE